MFEQFLNWLKTFFVIATVIVTPTPQNISYSTAEAFTAAPTYLATIAPTPINSPDEQIYTFHPTSKPTSRPTPVPLPVNNTAPKSGFSKQNVKTEIGNFVVNLVAADITSTKVIVDTASSSDCNSNCPALSLSEYVSRNGGWAGVNGTYFCPKEYPSCVGKENSFDLLVMNKDKYYFNSGNNVYSTNPAVVFGSGYVRFVNSGSQWGRDTGVNGVLMNYPLLVFNNNINFNGDGDPKKGSKGSRSFVANKGNTIYIGVTQNVTVSENALVMKALGMDNALNLDSGGSTALWHNGYKVGPGRGIPNAIIFK